MNFESYVLLVNFGIVVMMMVTGWLISLKSHNVTVVDSLWGLGFVLIAWNTFLFGSGYTGRSLLIALLTSIWGIRLTVYLTLRNRGKGEDPRYGSWRNKYGDRFWIVSLFNVFLVQAVFMWIIALATQMGQLSPIPVQLTWADWVGTAVWLTGFIYESVSDWQLARFKSDPANKGKVMDRGLWANTRHPNYFGEALIWWGFYVIVLATPGNWWTIISPVLITVTLIKITGVALTEKTTLERRPAYQEYIERTSAFVPWFKKRIKNECVDESCRSGNPA